MPAISETAIAILLCDAQRAAIARLLALVNDLEIPIDRTAADYLENETARLDKLAITFETRLSNEKVGCK
jgi:hypothetical protein